MTAQQAIDKMIADLEWRGPTGKPMGHIVLTREQAAALLLTLVQKKPMAVERLRKAMQAIREAAT